MGGKGYLTKKRIYNFGIRHAVIAEISWTRREVPTNRLRRMLGTGGNDPSSPRPMLLTSPQSDPAEPSPLRADGRPLQQRLQILPRK